MQDIWKNKDKSVIKYYIYDQQHSWKKCDLTGDRTLDHQFHADRSTHLSYQVIWVQRSVKHGYIPTQHTSSPVLPPYIPESVTPLSLSFMLLWWTELWYGVAAVKVSGVYEGSTGEEVCWVGI